MPREPWARRRAVAAILSVIVCAVVITQPGRSEPPNPAPPTMADRVRAMMGANQFAQAESLSRVHLADLTARGLADSLEGARALDLLVGVFRNTGKVNAPETWEFARRALAIKERILAPDDIEIAVSANNLGALHYIAAEFALAKPYFERVVAIREKALGPDDLRVGHGLNNLGEVLRNSGDHAAARPVIERALAIKTKNLGAEHPDAVMTRMNLGILEFESGHITTSRAILEEVLRIQEKTLDAEDPAVARTLNNLGNVLREAGELTRARQMFERALTIRQKVQGADHPEVATTLGNIAIVLTLLGDGQGGRQAYEQALGVHERGVGRGNAEHAGALNNLGLHLHEMGDLAGAKEQLTRSLEMLERSVGPDHFDVGQTAVNLATVLRDQGDVAGAEKYFARGIATLEKAAGPEHSMVGTALLARAAMLRRMRNPEAATLAHRAVAIAEKSLGSNHPDVAKALALEAALFLDRSDRASALTSALRAEQIGREHLSLMAAALSEEQALRYAETRPGGLSLALSVAGGPDVATARGSVLDAVIRTRALVLDEMASRHRALDTSDPETARLVEELSGTSQRLANLAVRGPDTSHPERYLPALTEARSERDRAAELLARRSVQVRQRLDLSRAGLTEITHALRPGQALVSYVLFGVDSGGPAPDPGTATGRQYLAFVLRQGQSYPDVIRLGAAGGIDSLVTAWKEEAGRRPSTGTFSTGERLYRSRAAALRQRIWDPVQTRLGKAQTVFIVPDGSLSLVSFGALPVGVSRYLVESGPLIHYLSAERDLLPPPPGGKGRGLLAIGAPAFDAAPMVAVAANTGKPGEPGGASAGPFRSALPACDRFRTAQFRGLPGTLRETEEIRSRWDRASGTTPDGRGKLLTGAEATERAFKNEAPGHRVLHIATHGFFLGGDCGSLGLHLSGLVLAGANQRMTAGPDEEDGVLTAEEVGALDLTGVEWAVLSACETGVGDIQEGEGVLGLRRAFQIAGARTLIMSLWSVQDEAARAWMAHLYEARLGQGRSTAEAVRFACRSALQERRKRGDSTHPFYWAAFVAAGDWR
ncbi:MAG TPA: CHAT domain-containing tetratricopeptide repeat protein [Candidatus Eisenbacteria bacterium]|nr:CHAT domain-containing tetratricopeptide repeat protein [Candidatus Eisenbacteria bacterium]